MALREGVSRVDEESADVIDTTLGLERDLQSALRKNLAQRGGKILNELLLPKLPDELTKRLKDLHEDRRKVQAERKESEPERLHRRRQLTDDERREVLTKTDGHCHLCGGDVTETSDGELSEERAIDIEFVVDHIVPVASGGQDSINNLLAAHGLCNGCR
jgi:5-methylcytosine-specific restriction endonuclease McrA